MKQINKKKCIVCEKEFIYYDERCGRTAKIVRGKTCITCSKKCAKAYARILNRLRSRKVNPKIIYYNDSL